MKKILEIANRVNKLTSFGNNDIMRSIERINNLQMRISPFIELQESISILKINQLSKAYSIALQFQDLLKNIEEVKGEFEEKDKIVSEVFERYEPFIRQKGIGLKHKEIFEKCFNEMPFDAYLILTSEEIYKIIRDYAKNEVAKYENDWKVEEKVSKAKPKKPSNFDELFSNEESKEIVVKAMIDLKIMNEKHEYILGSDRGF